MAEAGPCSAPPAHPDPFQAEILSLRAANAAAGKENSRLRVECSDKQYECEQLEKQIRRLERKIDALEDAAAGKTSETVKKGFFKPMPEGYQCPPQQSHKPDKPKPNALDKVKAGGTGIIIDGLTGEEVNPKEWWPDAGDDAETNPLLRTRLNSPAEELMWCMQNTIETNPDFDYQKYHALMAAQLTKEAEAMIKNESGPSLNQMQEAPLELLRRHPDLDPNYNDSRLHGCSLALWAATMGFDKVLRTLLEKRADPNCRSHGGMSCLAAACQQNRRECVGHLLEFRADPNEVVDNNEGVTILMWASRIEYCGEDGTGCLNPYVKLLLESAADPAFVDKNHKTALIHASTGGNDESVKALLNARADVDVKDSEGNTALQIALRYYHGKISSMLVPLLKKSGQVELPLAASDAAGPSYQE